MGVAENVLFNVVAASAASLLGRPTRLDVYRHLRVYLPLLVIIFSNEAALRDIVSECLNRKLKREGGWEAVPLLLSSVNPRRGLQITYQWRRCRCRAL